MAKITFSAAQKAAIDSRGRDLLVSAAAGSGKTAVLVERVIKMITGGPEKPVSVDRLLIVTFTEASAREMRGRIAAALDELIEADPKNTWLKRQKLLLNFASISTIHAFCLKVIRKYFHIAGIDPNFRTLNEAESALIKTQVCRELFAELHAAEHNASNDRAEGFWNLIEAMCPSVKDDSLQETIIRLHEKVRANAWPEEWLREAAAAYDVGAPGDIVKTEWYKVLAESAKHGLADAAYVIDAAIETALFPELDRNTYDELFALKTLLESVSGLIESDYLAACRLLSGYERLTVKQDMKKASEAKKEAKKALTAACNEIHKRVSEVSGSLRSRDPEGALRDMELCGAYVRTLADVLDRFNQKYAEAKREKNAVDFSDYEHLCLKILLSEEQGGPASELRKKYDEIFIDEYQDTNIVQEIILAMVSRAETESPNRFMVGDLKQSIYRFRLANPELFRQKYENYSYDAGLKRKIDLNENFRSRKSVINSVNFIFERIMSAELGEAAYDERSRLHYGAAYYDTVPDEGYETELFIIDGGSGESPEEDYAEPPEKAELEARTVAKRIRRLFEGEKPFQVYVSPGLTRDIKFSDIAIIMKSVKNVSGIYKRELKKLDIPAFSEDSASDYFTETEIMTMLSYLQTIDNPRQDIHLLTVLYSGIYNFTAAELLTIRECSDDKHFYGAALEYLRNGGDEALKGRLLAFFRDLAAFREKARLKPVSELVWALMNDTGFYDYAGAMPGGKVRRSNLLALFEAAAEFDASSLKGLFNFTRYFENIRKGGAGLGGKAPAEAPGDAVRIMTVHKSKGLEFPVVFLCGLGNGFNFQDTSGKLLVHQRLGFGMTYVDPERRTSSTTLIREAVKEKIRRENLSEEMRNLYVAMTRAKEKLILVGTRGGFAGEDKGLLSPALPGLLKKRRFLDWILPCVYENGENVSGWPVEIAAQPFSGETGAPARLRNEKPAAAQTEEEARKAAKKMEFSYEYSAMTSIPAKLSVTEVKRLSYVYDESAASLYERRYLFPDFKKPLFISNDEKISPARLGSLVHLVMEHADFSLVYDMAGIEELIASLADRKFMTPAEAETIDAAKIARFFGSNLAARIRASADIQKERSFVISLAPAEIIAEWAGMNSETADAVLVNGIIDCFFEEGGELVVVDYKTDRAAKGGLAELAAKYAPQMRLYKRAAEICAGKRVKETVIYSFELGREIVVET